MPGTTKPPEELRELVGLELNRRRLLRELIAVHVAIDKLEQEIRDRGIEVPWSKRGVPKTVPSEHASAGKAQ